MVCKTKTITHDGEARVGLCNRCSYVVNDGSGMKCGWTRINMPKHRKRNAMVDTILDLGVDYFYSCDDFQASRRDQTPSPNPLSFLEREELRDFYTLGVFWNDPRLWDNVDPHRDDVWKKQAERQSKSWRPFGIAALAVVSLALVAKKKEMSQ
jgi:hypothetical protein